MVLIQFCTCSANGLKSTGLALYYSGQQRGYAWNPFCPCSIVAWIKQPCLTNLGIQQRDTFWKRKIVISFGRFEDLFCCFFSYFLHLSPFLMSNIPKDVQWVWGLVTLNWKSMRASRPWSSLASGSFDAWSGSLAIWKMTAPLQNFKPVGMTSAESSGTSLCSSCSLSCANHQPHNRKP